MAKSADAFRTISEVAEWLDTPAHVLRFWESKFRQVKPVKRAGGRRYYRPNDMRLLGGIKQLLHEDGMTIKAVQKLLRENGVSHVAEFSQQLGHENGDDTVDVTPSIKPVVSEVKPKAPAVEEAEPATLAFAHRDTKEPDLPGFLSASRRDPAPKAVIAELKPRQVDVPDDPEDSIPAPAGVLGRISKLPRDLPPEVADQLQPLIARLRGRNDPRE